MRRLLQDQVILRELGLRLKEGRIKRRLTVSEMAKRIAVSARSYQRIESGVGSVGIEHYVHAASLLDIDFTKAFSEVLLEGKKRVRKKTIILDEEIEF